MSLCFFVFFNETRYHLENLITKVALADNIMYRECRRWNKVALNCYWSGLLVDDENEVQIINGDYMPFT